ncbi:hypothetical protein CFII68_17625 [Pseudomonas sp. CFII68]|nr:hypothetical protein CFII68_17625 [Pseudomonas sp. CFII68]
MKNPLRRVFFALNFKTDMLFVARGCIPHFVGARLARDAGDAVFQKSRRLFREQALLPQPSLATKDLRQP